MGGGTVLTEPDLYCELSEYETEKSMIEIKNLQKRFKLSREQKKRKRGGNRNGFIDAVDHISFKCEPGRIFTLLGPNGAGKTTTLRMIATLLKPTSGSISVCGMDTVKEAVEVRKRLGFLTGSTRLYDRLTPNEIIRYYADLHYMDKNVYLKRRDELFTVLDMHDFADWRIGKLSTGMKQKVSIARTMIHDPEVVVFDEPTVGLDVMTSQNIIGLIRQCREDGKTVIFSTHIMGEVSLLSDDMAIIHCGKLLYNGEYKDFTAQMSSGSIEEEFIRILRETEQ